MSTDELNVWLPRPVIVEIVDVPIVVDVIFTFPLYQHLIHHQHLYLNWNIYAKLKILDWLPFLNGTLCSTFIGIKLLLIS